MRKPEIEEGKDKKNKIEHDGGKKYIYLFQCRRQEDAVEGQVRS